MQKNHTFYCLKNSVGGPVLFLAVNIDNNNKKQQLYTWSKAVGRLTSTIRKNKTKWLHPDDPSMGQTGVV